MRRALLIIACLTMGSAIQADVGVGPFHGTYWFADGVVVGRVVEVGEMTMDIHVEAWLRDRTGLRSPEIRAFRYTRLSCVPTPPENYDVDSRYVFFMRKPYDEGAGGNEHWSIIFQHRLLDVPVCLDRLEVSETLHAHTDCLSSISEHQFIDALKTFDSCFVLSDDKILGSFPSMQTCSDEFIESWSSRSPMHAYLARTAKERLRKDQVK